MLLNKLFISKNPTNLHFNTHRKCNYVPINMGPVISAVGIYVINRIVIRVLKGQVFRKGVTRKLKRLSNMILEWHIIYEMIYDILEDI